MIAIPLFIYATTLFVTIVGVNALVLLVIMATTGEPHDIAMEEIPLLGDEDEL